MYPTFLHAVVPSLVQGAVRLAQSGMILVGLIVTLTVVVPIQAGQSALDNCLELLESYGLDYLVYRNKDAASYIDRMDFTDHVRYERIYHHYHHRYHDY